MNTSLGPGWPTRAMIGSGRTRARIEQTVGNICEISIGLRAAKDPGRSNALPEGAILIHRGHGHDVIVVVVGILDPGKLLLFQIVSQAMDWAFCFAQRA